MITTMGIRAADMQIDLSGSKLEVTKHMLSEPRRVGKVEINLLLPGNLEEKDRLILQKIGDNCPVMKSIHPDLQVDVTYKWGGV
jgi:uncharacterized OsmC-like protein